MFTFTFRSPRTPASSTASRIAASLTVSSFSHPPCQKFHKGKLTSLNKVLDHTFIDLTGILEEQSQGFMWNVGMINYAHQQMPLYFGGWKNWREEVSADRNNDNSSVQVSLPHWREIRQGGGSQNL